MIKAVIFDLDGTLVYVDKKYRRDLIIGLLEKFNINPGLKEIDEFWFMHTRSAMVEKWGIDTEEFWDAFRKHDSISKRIENSGFYEDVDYLETLKNKGIKLALLTGARKAMAEAELRMLGKDVFDIILIADPNGDVSSKPDPEGVKHCLRLLKIDKKEAIYVGNSDEDLLTAKNAGIYSVLVDRKEHSHSLIPDAKINSLFELDNIIRQL